MEGTKMNMNNNITSERRRLGMSQEKLASVLGTPEDGVVSDQCAAYRERNPGSTRERFSGTTARLGVDFYLVTNPTV